ncbi:MAG: serine hydrolase [Rhodothermales bacterium]
MNRRSFVSLCALPAICPNGFVRQRKGALPPIRPPSEDFQRQIPRLMEIAGVPGIGLALVQGDEIAWQYRHGFADRRRSLPVGDQTLWAAASLGKPVFAFAALHLVDEGLLDLDRPLKSYVPDHFPDDPRADRITARHALSHSSGLRNWYRNAGDPLELAFEPGSAFSYSGEGYYYLQRAIEHITGHGLDRFMRDRLFTPLGMDSSAYGWRPDWAERLVAGHGSRSAYDVFWKTLAEKLQRDADANNRMLADYTNEDVREAMARVAPESSTLPQSIIPNAAYSLVTTPVDFATYLVALLGGDVSGVGLKPETRQLAMTPAVHINSALGWGLGLGTEASETEDAAAAGDHYLWQWGDNGSWKNFVLAHPASRTGIVIFTNGDTGLNLCRRIIRASTGVDHAAFLWL